VPPTFAGVQVTRIVRRFLLGAALAAVCIAGYFLLRTGAPPVEPGVAGPTITRAAEHTLDIEDIGIDRARAPALSEDEVPETSPPSSAIETGRAEERWEDLKARADAGDTTASCKLAQRLKGCREARELSARIEEALTHAALRDDTDAAAIIAQYEADRLSYERSCGTGIPTNVVLREWEYLLRAAQAGHAPSMYRFVLNPPVDQSRPLEYLDAMEAYNRFALTLIDRLLASGSAEGLVAALIIESGQPIIGMTSLASGDPARRLQLAAALAILRDKPAILESARAAVADQLDTRAARAAIAAGERMSSGYAFQFADTSVGVEVDESAASCDASWAEEG
jgi:hypothetical protein